MYTKMKYGNIKGDSTESTHDGWIDIMSFSASANRSVGGSKTSMREIGSPNISEIQITKEICSATPLLFQEVLKGQGQSCEIQFLKTSENGVEAYCIYKLDDALITSHSISTSGSTPTECISISFTKIDLSFKSYDSSGAASNQTAVSYNFKEMR